MAVKALLDKTNLLRLTIYSVVLTSTLTGCHVPPSKSHSNICERVDPTHPDYSPDSLSLEQLKECRARAEKILELQSMQVQIHRQRDEVIAFSAPENELMIENKELIENALSKLPSPSEKTLQKSSSENKQVNKQVNRNVPKLDNTHQMTKAPTVQQHFIGQMSQTEFDAVQAQRVATKVDKLIRSDENQAILNAPRALLPGEEQIERAAGQNNAITTKSNLPKVNLNQDNNKQSNEINSGKNLIGMPQNIKNEVGVTSGEYIKISTQNSVTSTVKSENNTLTDLNKTVNEVKEPNGKSLSTDYRSLPKLTKPSPINAETSEKSDSEDASKEIPTPIIDGKTRPDPLLHLQQLRNQN